MIDYFFVAIYILQYYNVDTHVCMLHYIQVLPRHFTCYSIGMKKKGVCNCTEYMYLYIKGDCARVCGLYMYMYYIIKIIV